MEGYHAIDPIRRRQGKKNLVGTEPSDNYPQAPAHRYGDQCNQRSYECTRIGGNRSVQDIQERHRSTRSYPGNQRHGKRIVESRNSHHSSPHDRNHRMVGKWRRTEDHDGSRRADLVRYRNGVGRWRSGLCIEGTKHECEISRTKGDSSRWIGPILHTPRILSSDEQKGNISWKLVRRSDLQDSLRSKQGIWIGNSIGIKQQYASSPTYLGTSGGRYGRHEKGFHDERYRSESVGSYGAKLGIRVSCSFDGVRKGTIGNDERGFGMEHRNHSKRSFQYQWSQKVVRRSWRYGTIHPSRSI